VGDFEKILPDELTVASVRRGEELVLTYKRARQAIEMATEHLIAVLGVEYFQILDDGLGVETYSGGSSWTCGRNLSNATTGKPLDFWLRTIEETAMATS
jgi:hypothetical protein